MAPVTEYGNTRQNVDESTGEANVAMQVSESPGSRRMVTVMRLFGVIDSTCGDDPVAIEDVEKA